MTLRIIKPPKPGKMFVTLASTGYLFFSSRAVAELNLSEHKGVLLAHDERGALHLKVSYNTDPDAFRVYVRKNGVCSVTCIRVAPLFRRIGIEIKESTRYNLIEASEEGFYKIEGLKTK
jgi:hypothetical protein